MTDSDADSDRSDASGTRWLIIILCGVAAIRVLLMGLRPDELHTDPDSYVALGQTLTESGGFNQPRSEIPTAFRPPLYPFLLSTLFRCGMPKHVAVAVVNIAATLLLIVALYFIGRKMRLPPRWTLLALMCAAVDPLLLRYSLLPMTEVLAGAFLSLALLSVVILLEDDRRDGSRRSVFWAALGGICFGFGGLTRPVLFVTCAVVCGFILIFGSGVRSDEAAGSRRFAGRSSGLLMAVCCGLILSPWVLRNARAFHAFIPATTHGGYTLLLGNNEVFYTEVVQSADNDVWDGDSLDQWQNQLQQQIGDAGIARTDEPGIDRWMYARARQAIRQNRSAFLQACVLRWKRFWSPVPTAAIEHIPAVLTWGIFVWYTVLGIGLAGSVVGGKLRQRDIQMLWLAVLSFLLIHSFYWTNTRMRAPLTGVFCLLAATGWRNCYRFMMKRS